MRSRQQKETSDRELLSAIRDGREVWAFRLLYRRYTPRLYRFALSTLGGRNPEAEDMVQETWVRACRCLGTFRGDSALSTWLTGICFNQCRNLLQKSRRWQETSWEAVSPSETGAGVAWNPPGAARISGKIDLERAIERLPDRCRLVLILHDVEGWKHREIAAALDVSEGTSKSQLSLARRHMRESLRPSAEANHERA